MSLIEQGFRFMVNPHPGQFFFDWVHPAEMAERLEIGWKDCTDMNDAEYDAFMLSLEQAN